MIFKGLRWRNKAENKLGSALHLFSSFFQGLDNRQTVGQGLDGHADRQLRGFSVILLLLLPWRGSPVGTKSFVLWHRARPSSFLLLVPFSRPVQITIKNCVYVCAVCLMTDSLSPSELFLCDRRARNKLITAVRKERSDRQFH